VTAFKCVSMCEIKVQVDLPFRVARIIIAITDTTEKDAVRWGIVYAFVLL
jgi:hypothetical protein